MRWARQCERVSTIKAERITLSLRKRDSQLERVVLTVDAASSVGQPIAIGHATERTKAVISNILVNIVHEQILTIMMRKLQCIRTIIIRGDCERIEAGAQAIYELCWPTVAV